MIPSKCFNCLRSDLSYTPRLLSDGQPIGQQNIVFATNDLIGMQDNEHLLSRLRNEIETFIIVPLGRYFADSPLLPQVTPS